MSRRAVFLDRDGVINAVTMRDGVSRAPQTLADLRILPGVADAIALIRDAGFLRVVVTNQPDVSRGWQERSVVDAINDELNRALPLDAIFACFHDNHDRCACRKPQPGMLLQAAAEFDIDLSGSFMVGDRTSDVAAGQAAGCRTFYVGPPDTTTGADFCVSDLLGAAKIIVGLSR